MRSTKKRSTRTTKQRAPVQLTPAAQQAVAELQTLAIVLRNVLTIATGRANAIRAEAAKGRVAAVHPDGSKYTLEGWIADVLKFPGDDHESALAKFAYAVEEFSRCTSPEKMAANLRTYIKMERASTDRRGRK